MKLVAIAKKNKIHYDGPVVCLKTKNHYYTLGNGIISHNCELPDIDCDFEDTQRHRVREHVQELYGINNVAGISTFLTLKGRGSFKDVCRVFDIKPKEANDISKLLDDDEDLTKEKFFDNKSSFVRDFANKHKDIVDYSCRLQHVLRGYGQHAAGVCISDTDLRDGTKCNLVKRKGEIVCNWDKDDAEYMGLVKIDFLGLSALSRIHECLNLIKETGDEIDINNIDLNDKEVYQMIDDGDTIGIFQLGTYGIKKLCQNLGIDEFKDLYNATALYRPGPLGAGITDEFVARKNGKSYTLPCEEMEEITKDTYGCIIYQEQVMFACNKIGGMDWGKCDKIRKLMAKSKGVEALAPFKEEFVNNAIKNTTLNKEKADKLWEQLTEFGKYGFNKCLDPNTIVLTSKGEEKSIKDVTIGEYINTPEGYCEIIDKHDNGLKEVYRVVLENGKTINCTLDHKFLCKDGQKHTVRDILFYDLEIICDDFG